MPLLHCLFRSAATLAIGLALAALLSAAAPAQATPSAPAAAPITPAAHKLCVQAATEAERTHQVPPYLISAVSLAETGRWSGAYKASFSWPWTVMAEGVGRYLPTKAAAIAEVRHLQARGIRNIDVGCLQINLHYHGDAFEDLEEAFDPHANADYAGAFLADLMERAGRWDIAVAQYHSRDAERGPAYRQRVFDLWYGQRRHLIASATGEIRVPTAAERARDAFRAEVAKANANRLSVQQVQEAARQANVAFLQRQAAILEARSKAAFEARKAAALAEWREMKRKREAAKAGG